MNIAGTLSNGFASREKVLAPLLVAVFFLLNFSIASRSPFGAWMDEVTYVDPGLNLAAGRGWTSSAWPWQTDHEFWAQNSPLYPAGLSVWVRVFGASMVACRSYGYALAAVGMLLLWAATFRFRLLGPVGRLFWIVVLSSEYAMNWMARNERYDVWIFLGVALAFFGASLRGPGARYALIFIGCFLVPWAGFIGVPQVVLLAGLAAVLTGFAFAKEAVIAVAGAGCGVLGVLGFFASAGELQTFRGAVSHLSELDAPREWPFAVFLYPREDWGLALMIGVLLLLTVYFWAKADAIAWRWLGLGWGVVLFMPALMLLRGVFPMMYFYQVIVPLSLAILQLAGRATEFPRGRCVALAVTIALGVICLGGLPGRIYFAASEWNFRDPHHLRDFVRAQVQPGEGVYSDYPFYFELRDRVSVLALPHYLRVIPAEEAGRIDVALVPDGGYPGIADVAARLKTRTEDWEKVAVFPTPEMMGLPHHASTAQKTYTLYRRMITSP